MKRSKENIAAAATETEAWLDDLEDETDPRGRSDLGDLRAIAEAADAITAAQVRLREAVAVSQGRGRSWGQIGAALGTSRQAARQRFGPPSGMIGLSEVAAEIDAPASEVARELHQRGIIGVPAGRDLAFARSEIEPVLDSVATVFRGGPAAPESKRAEAREVVI